MVAEAITEPEVAKDEEDANDCDVQEHLKDAMEGTLRLKRALTQDDNSEAGAKKAKTSPEGIKVAKLMKTWGCPDDTVVEYVLDQLSSEELDQMIASKWQPDLYSMHKSAGELLAKYVGEMRERKLPPGGNFDIVKSFCMKWKLQADCDKALRALAHKELRYVIEKFDGTKKLAEFIIEAAAAAPEIEDLTVGCIPTGPGAVTMSRFCRLELIDPVADAAVFGDANLTFALRLAKHRKALGHVGRVIATTFEELPTLQERYPEIDESIKTLEDQYAEVYHGVDCTRIAINPQFEGLEGSLGAVYYNFPHSGAVQGFFDGHPVVNWRHENLMRLFFRALRSFVKPGGVVKVASNMGAVGVRYSYIVGSALQNEFIHTETMPFLEWHLHRYGRSYGDRRDVTKRLDASNNQSYNAQNAERDMVYCFKYAPSGEVVGKQEIRMPPTLKTLMACEDGPFKGAYGEQKKRVAMKLHERFVTEISGTHVG